MFFFFVVNFEFVGIKGVEVVLLIGVGFSRIEGLVIGDVGGGGFGGDFLVVWGFGGRFVGVVLGVGFVVEVGFGWVGGVVEVFG